MNDDASRSDLVRGNGWGTEREIDYYSRTGTEKKTADKVKNNAEITALRADNVTCPGYIVPDFRQRNPLYGSPVIRRYRRLSRLLNNFAATSVT